MISSLPRSPSPRFIFMNPNATIRNDQKTWLARMIKSKGNSEHPRTRIRSPHVVLQRGSPEPSIPARAELLRGAPGLRGGGGGVGVPPHRAPRPGPQRRRRGGGAPRLGHARRRRQRRRRPPPRGRGRQRRGGRRGKGRGRRVRPDAPGHRRRRRRVHELRPPRRCRPLRAAPREVHGQGSKSSNEDHKKQYSWTYQKQQCQRSFVLLPISQHSKH